MLSLTTATASTPSLVSPNLFPHLSPHSLPSVIFIFNSRRPRKRIRKQFLSLNFVDVKETRGSCSLPRFSNGLCGGGAGGFNGFVRRCVNWDSEGDIALEAEILEFMKESKNPESFPSKKELVEAGRLDLVEGIVKRGGWLSLGWDFSDGEEENVEEIGDRVSLAGKECDSVFDSVGNEVRSTRVVSYFSGNSSQSTSPSGSSLEMAAEDESGVEGILNRLEKQRNMTFGFGLREKGDGICFQSNKVEDDWHSGTSIDVTVAGLERSIKPTSLSTNNHNFNNLGGKLTQNRSFLDIDGLGNSLKPDMWRTWSIQRAEFSDADFEAAEISSNRRMEGPMDASGAEILEIREVAGESLNTSKELNSSHEEINHNQIRDRLQHMELELSSVLCSLRSNAGEVASQKGHESFSDDLQELSDAWEFQENEIMNAQDRLRSIRAKLAVVEGKMALAIIDAQKLMEEKQNRIDDARRTLLLLRSACIVWPNSASKVLLAGSFDGWATQRKMEKSSTGVFSLCLKLYPGRYEIKFIVDGEWKIDPLRPIVNNNGYENNVLIIT